MLDSSPSNVGLGGASGTGGSTMTNILFLFALSDQRADWSMAL
jgi:hypothetical protein